MKKKCESERMSRQNTKEMWEVGAGAKRKVTDVNGRMRMQRKISEKEIERERKRERERDRQRD